ncbi:3-carboxyethylcatechol 2,3-dioxygenase [Rhodococcus koreensis]
MTLALCAMSHSPLIGHVEVDADKEAQVSEAFATAQSFVEEYDPELVVVFAPDHFNGVYYRMMPAFCIGAAASGVGDYGTSTASLDVPAGTATELAAYLLADDIDVAVSHRMELDHAFMQPLELLFGDPASRPTIPFFINCAAPPLGRPSRARAVGDKVGRFFADRDERVLFVASGGLSHDPPMPSLVTSPEPVRERIIAGRPMTADERATRERGAIAAANQMIGGESSMLPLNPQWDNDFLDILRQGSLAEVDKWSPTWCENDGGAGAQEVRTWIAAAAAAASQGPYTVDYSFYQEMPAWIAGFGVLTARSDS